MTDYKIQMKRFNGTDYDNLFPIPHGYGLGEADGKTISSLDEITKFGFYRLPTGLGITPDDASNWGALFVGPNINYGNLIACRGGYVAIRSRSAGVFGPWEWLNPPMTVGVEYRTTERYNGKPVYTKLVDCGYAPVNTYKNITVTGMDNPISVTGVCAGSTIPSMSFGTGYMDTAIDLQAYPELIQLTTQSWWESGHDTSPVYVIAKYTKNTD